MQDDVKRCENCGASIAVSAGSDPVPERSPVEGGGMLTGRIMQVSRLATIGEMASGIAHELNQPLAAITSYAQASARILKSPAPDLADIQEALEEISAQAQRAGDIIRRMRNLVTHGEVKHAAVNGNALIEEMRDLLQADARVHDVRLALQLQRGIPSFSGDPGQIQHVLMILARNAMEAVTSLPAGQREVAVGTTAAADGSVELFVKDNGPGLTQEALDRLAEPFFTTKPNGTGLGLAISNTIARAHGGELGYRRNTPAGACLYIRIPPLAGES